MAKDKVPLQAILTPGACLPENFAPMLQAEKTVILSPKQLEHDPGCSKQMSGV